jgi:hypothetical protein
LNELLVKYLLTYDKVTAKGTELFRKIFVTEAHEQLFPRKVFIRDNRNGVFILPLPMMNEQIRFVHIKYGPTLSTVAI